MEGVMELGRDGTKGDKSFKTNETKALLDIVQAPDPKSIGPPANQRHQGFIDPISTSVPADWHWSTF
ncbi:hypothetical protein DFQ28_002309 [Apophysomyces sp. BC1034]|nr:hypothetical protein DFQ29_009814 [Apophysomyces sp. BC1021]KAG0193945.1 hypothetical protein DFQ28_002309 [Apophysomyces sp. BC1034]